MRFRRFNKSVLAMLVIMSVASIATVTYAALTTQVTTSQEQVTISSLGTVNCTINLTDGNIYVADSTGAKTSTQCRLHPAGYFAVPLTFTYSGDARDSGYQKVAIVTGDNSFTFSSMAVVCQGGGSGGAGTNQTQFNKYFTTAKVMCSTTAGANVITAGTNNVNYYLFLVTKSPAATNSSPTPSNYLTKSISSITINFSVTAYTV